MYSEQRCAVLPIFTCNKELYTYDTKLLLSHGAIIFVDIQGFENRYIQYIINSYNFYNSSVAIADHVRLSTSFTNDRHNLVYVLIMGLKPP